MTYLTNQKRKPSFPLTLLLILIIIGLGVISAVSLNKIRAGQPGFLTNLWASEPKFMDDPILSTTPNTLAVPNHVKTIMLLGSDYRPELGYRTDVMLLAAFNLETNQINFFSFPRDLWVNIPGIGEQRLNVAHPFGDYQLLSDTLASNFGFRPDHFMLVDFDGFKYLIDVLDGIDVEVTQYTSDECWLNDTGWCEIQPGTVHMDTGTAFWYVRARKNSSDLDRTRRAQEVVKAMIKKAFSPSEIGNLDNFVRAVFNTVETDLDLGEYWMYALPLSKFFNLEVAGTYTLNANQAIPGMTAGGASVLFPDYLAIQTILKEALWVEQ